MKPMLSATLTDTSTVKYPVLVSPKLDGIRCLIDSAGRPVTRNLKDVPNKRVWHALYELELTGLDGEIIVGSPKAEDCYRRTNSGIMSHEGSPDWTYWVFDFHSLGGGDKFTDRLNAVKARLQKLGDKRIRIVPHLRCENEEQLLKFEGQQLAAGYEGVMGRALDGPYKQGRATLREGWLWKLKRFSDGEAEILGFVEQLHNANEKTQDNLGHAKRSSHKENKHGKDTLGALRVCDISSGVCFEVGTGFTDRLRTEIWADKGQWLGKVIKYKSMLVGVKEKPRFPVFMGLRTDI